MNNRKKLIKTNEYELLTSMHWALRSFQNDICIMDLLKSYTKERCEKFTVGGNKKCNDCIACWLNEEEV